MTDAQVQPLTAENLEKWTNAHDEIKEELQLAFIMRYVREQSRLAATIPREPQEPKAAAPETPQDAKEAPEILSSAGKPSKKNLVNEMRRKDGSTPDAAPPHRKKQIKSTSKVTVKEVKEIKEPAKPKNAKADVHSISSSSSSSSASKERKQPGRETAPARNHREKKPEKKVADPEPVSFDLRTNIKDFGKRPRKQKEDEEDSVSSEEVVEAPAKKRRQSAKSAPPKTKAKGKKGKDDHSQSRLVPAGARLTIRKPGADVDNADPAPPPKNRDAVLSIANKLGIFNKGKASSRLSLGGPSLSFNESRFLEQDDRDKSGKERNLVTEAKVVETKATEQNKKKDGSAAAKRVDQGTISHFFSEAVQKTQHRQVLDEDVNDDDVFSDDLPPPPDSTSLAKGATGKAAARESAVDEDEAKGERSEKRVPSKRAANETESATVETTKLQETLKGAIQSRAKENAKPADANAKDDGKGSNPPPKQHLAERDQTHGRIAKRMAVDLRRKAPSRKDSAPPVDMEHADDLVMALEESLGHFGGPIEDESLQYANYEQQQNHPHECNGNEEFFVEDGAVAYEEEVIYECEPADHHRQHPNDGEWDNQMAEQEPWPRYHHDQTAEQDFVEDDQLAMGQPDELLGDPFFPPEHEQGRNPEEPDWNSAGGWYSQPQRELTEDWGDRRRSLSEEVVSSNSHFLSMLPWKATKPSVPRQQFGKFGAPVSVQRASWRFVADSLVNSNKALTDSPPRSLGPFARPNYLF